MDISWSFGLAVGTEGLSVSSDSRKSKESRLATGSLGTTALEMS